MSREKSRGILTSDKSETPVQIHPPILFQNGELRHPETCALEKKCHVQLQKNFLKMGSLYMLLYLYFDLVVVLQKNTKLMKVPGRMN